jgi:TIR domain/Alpha/beta hydrolase family
MARQSSVLKSFNNHGASRAVIFLHGFSGDRDDTWDRFPLLLREARADWDVFTLGYDTTFLPDIAGLWSADPDLEVISKLYLTSLEIEPLGDYRELALVGHSMGGLVVQAALTKSAELRARTKKVVLFGTPSDGLRKANLFAFWKRQLNNMAAGSPFITGLREDWTQLGADLPFQFLAVAGTKDQFVPPDSSLTPFAEKYQRVVPGDHLQIVKPNDENSESVRLLLTCLRDGAEPVSTTQKLRLAAETAISERVAEVIQAKGTLGTEAEIVDAALAMDRVGKRAESIELLQAHLDVGTDVQATLGGRFKRLWLASRDEHHATRATELYAGAHKLATARNELDQMYYCEVNLSFLSWAAKNDKGLADDYAWAALTHARQAKENTWSVATQAEANLCLGNVEEALALYRRLPQMEKETWKLVSAGQQAFNIAGLWQDHALADEIDAIFTTTGGKIFVGYAREDASWLDKLKLQLAPYLPNNGHDLELWDDQRIQPGQKWEVEIDKALRHCNVAVLIVSEHFLNSVFIRTRELPELERRSANGQVKLLWFTVTSCPHDAVNVFTTLQALRPPDHPLDALAAAEQNKALLEISRKVRSAALEPRRLTAGGPPG